MGTQRVARRRHIGPIGTSARVVIGVLLFVLGAVGGKIVVVFIGGHLHVGLNVAALILGIVIFPAVLLAWQWIRLRRDTSRLDATGPVATGVNILAFAILIWHFVYPGDLIPRLRRICLLWRIHAACRCARLQRM